jgi:hypothetical protein
MLSSRIKDMKGHQTGKLQVVGFSHVDVSKAAYWTCQCSCGNTCVVRGYALRAGTTRSCGCAQLESATKHGLRYCPESSVWRGMLHRCRDSTLAGYGGRGITVCEEWRSFETFYKDMGPRPSPQHSIDRINNDGPYCKDNCRWATKKEQGNNRRCSVLLTHNGETKTVAEWSAITGLNANTLYSRVDRGWSDSDILTKPLKR